MLDALLQSVKNHLAAHADRTGFAQTSIPGLATVRATAPSGILHAIYRPLVCVLLQGRKRVTTGAHSVEFTAGDSLLVTADVPTVSQITTASPTRPYLSLVIELDPALIAELAVQMATDAPPPSSEEFPLHVQPTDQEVIDAALRLMRLLDRPAAIPILHAPLRRELHYWLLAGRHGPAIRRLGFAEGHVQRVAKAVARLRSHFAQPLAVDDLAQLVGLSPSAFYQHFKAATSLSPRQFQKQLRLIEARRLMLAEGITAANAAYAVGYESVPQFTREYRRMFGLPPARDREQQAQTAFQAA